MQENCLGEVELGGNTLLLGLSECFVILAGDENNCQGIARIAGPGEDIEGDEIELHDESSQSSN
jgi:hypothetical protein